jgi:hypothetical protein
VCSAARPALAGRDVPAPVAAGTTATASIHATVAIRTVRIGG